jgi:hypothetical protein
METLNHQFVSKCYTVLKSSQTKEHNQHQLFLTACLLLKPDLDVEQFSKKYPHGGKIGIGDSWLNMLFNRSKMLRLHAAFHDAFGSMKSVYNIGPGYCYAFDGSMPNICFMGHVSGIGFWIYISSSVV